MTTPTAESPRGFLTERQPTPLQAGDFPAVGGKIGPDPEDFVVEEIPAYEPSGAGEHWYVLLKKRGMNTRDAALALARAARVSERDVGYAGMKDKHAVTTQWLSLPGAAAPPETYELPPGLEVLGVSRHSNKLRTGHLRGNRFRIRLVGAHPDGVERARAILARLAESGLLNAFGVQRYGRNAENLPAALAFVRGEERLPRGKERFLAKLYASVVQSEAFNRYATARAALGLERLISGEVVRLSGASASFVVDDLAREAPRFAARDLELTGPLPGPKLRPTATGAARELELAALAELGLGERELENLGRHAPGTRRDLLVRPAHVEAGSAGDAIFVAFELPSGSYATEVMRELLQDG